MNNNLKHALGGMCEDPDCELHMIEVGRAEGTVTDTNLAFFLAGVDRILDLVEHARFAAKAELLDQIGEGRR